MRISFVDAPSFANRLKNLFSNCTKLDVAMAYVRIGGLKTFLNALNDSALIKENKPVRIVFGLSSFQGITDKKSAEMLLRISRKQKNVIVKKYDNPGFHPKLMIFHGEPNRILVGSSNLTEGAQSKNAEANVIVEDPDSKFMKDAVEFFETYFDNAPHLERMHVESYTPRYRVINRIGQESSRQDELPPHWKFLPPLGERGRRAGKPIKSKNYYEKKIRDLESKKELTKQQRRSLAAYRALRTRYYGPPKRAKRLAILQPVTHGQSHLETIVEEGRGIWKTGCKIHEDHSLEGVHIYFYENPIKQVRYRATIQRIQRIKGKTHLTMFNPEKLKKSRELRDFKNRNGENVRAMRRFAYISDPDVV